MINKTVIDNFYEKFPEVYRNRIDEAIRAVVKTKQEHKKIAVVTGSGPNLHEGVTTLIAELINKGMIDGVLTSSAVIAHEMAGCLDKVKRIDAKNLDLGKDNKVWLPKGDIFELTMLNESEWKELEQEPELKLDKNLIKRLKDAEGKVIIKAAGNMAYPMGLRTELLAEEILKSCIVKFNRKYSFEYIAGLGAHPLTMIGAGAIRKVPILVSIPQMIGGGSVGLSVGDSISIHDRCERNARILNDASVIIESGLALAQEIHDGPFETYTGHGIWSQWMGHPVFSLKGKTLIRLDLDPNLEKAWQQQRESGLIQQAIADGKPKTKLTGIPFRMEMSGFARLESSIPIVGDLGEIWPIIMSRAAEQLGIKLDFMSYKQETDEGIKMREYIVDNVNFINKKRLLDNINKLDAK
jgi:hypothetical protein